MLASQIVLHIAAMNPLYLDSKEVPQIVLDKALEDLKGKGVRKQALEKLYIREVLLEQELATSEDAIKIRDLI